MFREKFRYYKRKVLPPDLSSVLYVENKSDFFSRVEGYIDQNVDYDELGVVNPSLWKIYELNCYRGLFLVRNPFTCTGQRYWISKCLSSYTRKPNITNLYSHSELSDIDDWWECCNRHGNNSDALRKSLRWATLGYHHNWDTKVYSETSKNEFPAELQKLCDLVMRTVLNVKDYSAEAAIVNFYHMDSTLSGHRDCSEDNKEAPLISFSFGQSAIFLVGGLTLAEDATAMFLQSGDVVIMTAGSRLRYHGIPKIVKASVEPWNDFNGNTRRHDNADTSINSIGSGVINGCSSGRKLLSRPMERDDNKNLDHNKEYYRLGNCRYSSEENKIFPKSEQHHQSSLRRQPNDDCAGRDDDDDDDDNNHEAVTGRTNYKREKKCDNISKSMANNGHYECLYKDEKLEEDTWWKPFDRYVKCSRINVNARQVLYASQQSLPR